MFPCYMLQTTGVPCMACGMTTSFAWFARGNLPASLYIQPMGMVLALLSVMSFWGGLYIASTGRQVYRLLSYLPWRLYFVPLTTWAVLAWGWKIFIHLQHLDGWRV